MKIVPTKGQWNKWSLPTKAGYFSVWIGVMSLIVTLALHILSTQLTTQENASTKSGIQIDELIGLFNLRAKIINEELYKYYKYTEVESYLNQFNDLHKKHIEALQKCEFILAHEYLTRIYKISNELSYGEFWINNKIEGTKVAYYTFPRPENFTRGELIWQYITGDFISSKRKLHSSVRDSRYLAVYDSVYELSFNKYKYNNLEIIEESEELEQFTKDILITYELILENPK